MYWFLIYLDAIPRAKSYQFINHGQLGSHGCNLPLRTSHYVLSSGCLLLLPWWDLLGFVYRWRRWESVSQCKTMSTLHNKLCNFL